MIFGPVLVKRLFISKKDSTDSLSSRFVIMKDMCITIIMATKNIYVSEQDLPLFKEAMQYADSLSTAVVLALRLFIDTEKEKESGNKVIELKVSSDGREIIKRFIGNKIYKFSDRSAGKMHITEIFLTKKKNYVLYERTFTDWSMFAEHAFRLSDDPRSWYIDYPDNATREMSVYKTLDELKLQLPKKLAQKVMTTESTYKSVEDLDI